MQRSTSTMNLESMDLGDQASLENKRALKLGRFPRSSKSLTEIGKVSHWKNGRYHPASFYEGTPYEALQLNPL